MPPPKSLFLFGGEPLEKIRSLFKSENSSIILKSFKIGLKIKSCSFYTQNYLIDKILLQKKWYILLQNIFFYFLVY